MRRRSGLGILLVLCILTGMLLEPAEQVQAKKRNFLTILPRPTAGDWVRIQGTRNRPDPGREDGS